MNILALNAGSSSLKFCLFRMREPRGLAEAEDVLARGRVERIGTPEAQLTLLRGGHEPIQQKQIGTASIFAAAQQIIRELMTLLAGETTALAVDAIGHRIVHGGKHFVQAVQIDQEVMEKIRRLSELAPLHNPAGLEGIHAAQDLLPQVKNIAVFDTSFHHTMPEVATRYALPAELCEQFGLRRYGFHGISYRYVAEQLSRLDPYPARCIICHLGNGASVCAMKDGMSVDTSMGFTPMEGLIMGSRCGDIDPGLMLHLQRAGNMTFERLEKLLDEQSGLLGLSGVSGDVRDLEKTASEGHQSSQLALECFAYRVRKYIGAYAAALGGVDGVVFTGGIGQYSAAMRTRICEGLDFLALTLDERRNTAATGEKLDCISTGQDERIWVVPAEEEHQIAREVFTLMV